jgi:hypothetical protein
VLAADRPVADARVVGAAVAGAAAATAHMAVAPAAPSTAAVVLMFGIPGLLSCNEDRYFRVAGTVPGMEGS